MDVVEDIKNKVENFSPDQLARFRKWFQEFQAQRWDEQFEADVEAGRLDTLAEEAINDFKKGSCSEL